jgi:hypothetical protein
MSEPRRRATDSPAILPAGAVVACAAAAAVVSAQLVNDLVFDRRYWHLNADVEGNALTWVSAIVTAAAAALAITLSRALGSRRLAVVGVILAFFAIDDIAALHERMGQGLDSLGLPHADGIWFPVYLPLFAFAFFTLLATGRRVDQIGSALLAGLLLLGFALVGEVATAFLDALDRTEHGVWYSLEVGLEEAAELAGWILITAGLGAGLVLMADEHERTPEAAPLLHH